MTSFGRGRGWAYNQDKETILRKPGNIIPKDGIKWTDITDKITELDVNNYTSSRTLGKIIELMKTIDKANLKDVCNNIFKHVILCDTLTIRTAIVFCDNNVVLLEDNNKELVRHHLLYFLQQNYMTREQNRVEDKKTFANIVLLHAEVYYRLRLTNRGRLEVLAEPLVHYLEDLLQNNTQENIHFAMMQIFRSGKQIYLVCPKVLENFIIIIREMLIKDVSPISLNRTMLLLIIELANNNYEIVDVQLKQFYLSNMKSLRCPFAQEESRLSAEKETKNDQFQDVDSNEQTVKEVAKSEKSECSNYLKGSNTPRAIRGSGATDIRKEDNINVQLQSVKITSREKTNKGWHHDDRFHKDYE